MKDTNDDFFPLYTVYIHKTRWAYNTEDLWIYFHTII